MSRRLLILAAACAAISPLAASAAPAAAHGPGAFGSVIRASSGGPADTFRGRLEIRHSDDLRSGVSRTRYTLVSGRRHRRLLLESAPPRVRSGARVTVRGRRVRKAIRGRIQPSARASAEVGSLGPRKVAVVLFNFSNDTRQPWTSAFVRQRVFTDSNSTSAFFREQSYDQVQLVGRDNESGDVYGWYTIADDNSGCDINTWTNQARNAVTAAGGSLAGYDHVIFAFPNQASCDWGGLGELPGDYSWTNGSLTVRILAHELGHNMGLHHASSYRCVSGGIQVQAGGTCTADEYGDPFDVMGGYGSRHSHAWHLDKLRYLGDSNVRTVSQSGTYTVRSAATQSTAVNALRVPRSYDSLGRVVNWYEVEYRTPTGLFDNFLPTDAVVNGVSIRVVHDRSTILQSLLMDATPGSVSEFQDGALSAGRTFTDGAVSITTNSISGSEATVSVVLGPVPDARPSKPTGLQATVEAGAVRLRWIPSTDDQGIARYTVVRDGKEIGSTTGTAFTDSAVAPGELHYYTVAAVDTSGQRSDWAVGLTVQVPRDEDLQAPAVTIRSPGDGRTVRRPTKVAAQATDDAAVERMELWIDGKLKRRQGGSSLAYSWRPARGRHTVEVRAFDPSGNRGSRRVRVRAR
jgi:hypothetical protein